VGITVSVLTKMLADPRGDNESLHAYLHLMLHYYQDIIEDEHMVTAMLVVAATIYNLNNKLSEACRANIIAALDARQNGQAIASMPFTHLSTMLI
jgi:hypothetical protein